MTESDSRSKVLILKAGQVRVYLFCVNIGMYFSVCLIVCVYVCACVRACLKCTALLNRAGSLYVFFFLLNVTEKHTCHLFVGEFMHP